MSAVRTRATNEQRFPPDERLSLPGHLTFARLLAAVVVVVAVVDYARVGPGGTQFPYDYPFFVAIVYLLGLVFVLPRIHGILDRVKVELVDLAARTATENPVSDRDTDVSPEEIRAEFERTTRWAFDPRLLLAGALMDGTFTVGAVTFFDAWSAYSYHLTTFVYGAGHGLFYFPIFGTMVLTWKLSRHLLVDVDLLDPDGVGGYRPLGDAIVSLIVLVVVFLALDFLVISSVSSVDPALFRILALLLYAGMVLSYAVIAAAGIVLLRRRLFELRDRKAARLRRQFREAERRYWERDESTEAERIRTLDVLLSRLPRFGSWPFHRLALFRLLVAVTASLALLALHVDLILRPW